MRFIKNQMLIQKLFCFAIPITSLIGICFHFDFIILWPGVLSFVAFGIYGFVKQLYDGKSWCLSMFFFSYPFLTRKRKYFLCTLITICFGVSVFSMVILMVYGGNPAMENGIYVIQSHAETVKSITEQEYRFLKPLSKYGYLPIIYVFTVCAHYLAKNDYINRTSGDE